MNQEENKRYVAYFDMLGMKTATLRNQDAAWKALCAINNAKKKIAEKEIEIINSGEKIGDRVRAQIFSDSVIIFSLGDEPKDLLALLIYSSEFFKDSLSQSVPLRGGIAYGDFFFNFDSNLFLGTALVKACEIGECAQWYGITVETEVYNRSKELPVEFGASSNGGMKGIVEYDVPLKVNKTGLFQNCFFRHAFRSNPKTKKGHVINWPGIFRNNFVKIPQNSEELYEAFENLFGSYAGLRDEVKQKHINTYNFVVKQLSMYTKNKSL